VKRILHQRLFWPFAAFLAAALLPSPAMALGLGAGLAILAGNPQIERTGRLSKQLLQLAVILLGFGMPLDSVLRVGAESVGITLVSITATMALGFALGRLLGIDRQVVTLVSSGTAICGGSAIAAVAPAIGASAAATAVSLAVVFTLNAVGLLVFPLIGHGLGLDQETFGVWAALAIHDTSSVVGATAIYGTAALTVGTTVKLTRALWILPLSMACARMNRSSSGAKIPWFLGGFLLAALTRSLFAGLEPWCDRGADLGRFVMIGTLFLIGAGLTRASLRAMGMKPLALAVILWIIVSVASLVAIEVGWIDLGPMG